jgi:hypothetical protein
MDAYEEMGFGRELPLDAAVVRQRFQDLSKARHPDAGGDAESYQRLVAAARVLESPGRRLRHWAELQGAGAAGPVVAMDADLGGLFGRVAEVLAVAREATRERETAGTAIGRAMAERRAMAAQELVETALGRVGELWAQAEEQMAVLAGQDEPEPQAVAALAARFSYLEKWRGELREALARLA